MPASCLFHLRFFSNFFLQHPAQVQGLYCLEGESHNTFVSSLAVLETMQREAPDLFPYMLKSPMVVGRVAHFYDPPMFQATIDPAVTMTPGFPNHVKRVRWHPHLAGSLLAPFQDFIAARKAYQKFQEIARRPSHQLTLQFRPGDLYIWDNFHTLHGRERVISTPRTSVGQTVSEQVVSERYRSLQIMRLKELIDEAWLVHVPTPQLYELAKLFRCNEVSVDTEA
jgi:trimethyllysine dioxygenase